MTSRLLAASAAAASLAAIALYTRRRRPAEVRRAQHMAWLKAIGFTSVEASLAVSLALECGKAMLCTAGRTSARWKGGGPAADLGLPWSATSLFGTFIIDININL